MKAARLLAVFAATGILPAAGPARELRFTLPADPRTFDALHVSDQPSETIRYLTGGVLLRINRVTDQLQPELAESWKITPDGRAIIFHLRAGLKFSDGSPLIAADVARTLNTALDPKQASPAGDTLRSGRGDPEVRVVSALDVSVRYPQPKAGIDRIFDQISIVPQTSAKLPPSAGPFFVAGYKPGEQITLARNPNYWKHGQPDFDSIRMDIQSNREIELARFLRGEIHAIQKLEPEAFDRVKKEQPAAARNLGASLDPEFLWFNMAPAAPIPDYRKKWFSSAAFRHAISQSIHRDDLARVVFRGYAHPAAGPISASNRFWFNASLKPLPYDAQSAMRNFAADGFVLRDGVLRDRDGHEVEFSLVTNSGNRARAAMAAFIQDDLRNVGIRVNVVTLDFGSLIERISRTLNYEAALLGYSNVAVDPIEDMNVWLSSGPQHAWWPEEKSPATPWEARIDQLELDQAAQPDRRLRKRSMDEVQRIAVEQEPIIYLVYSDYLAAISPLLRGVQPVAEPPQLFWNIESLGLK